MNYTNIQLQWVKLKITVKFIDGVFEFEVIIDRPVKDFHLYQTILTYSLISSFCDLDLIIYLLNQLKQQK